MHVHISKGNIKLGNIPNINQVPILTCAENIPCKDKCYSMKSYRQYPNVRNAYKENFELFNSNSNFYFLDIVSQLTKMKNRRVRWHSAGDIINQIYLQGMIDVANKLSHIKFLCYTKKFNLDFSNLPRNLNIYASIWPGLEIPNLNLPRAWLKNKQEVRIPQNTFICKGSCKTCARCWNSKKDIVFIQH